MRWSSSNTIRGGIRLRIARTGRSGWRCFVSVDEKIRCSNTGSRDKVKQEEVALLDIVGSLLDMRSAREAEPGSERERREAENAPKLTAKRRQTGKPHFRHDLLEAHLRPAQKDGSA